MRTGTDFETIDSLHQLQNSVQGLLEKSQERYHEAKRLQEDADLVRGRLNQVLAVHRSLEALGEQGDISQLLADLKITQESLILFKTHYDSFSTAILETLHLIRDIKTGLLASTEIHSEKPKPYSVSSDELSCNDEAQVIQHFVESLIKLSLKTEASAIIDTVNNIGTLRQDLIEQQNIFVNQMSTANTYLIEFSRVEQSIDLSRQQIEDLIGQGEKYVARFDQLKDVVQADANRVAESANSIKQRQNYFQEQFQKAQKLLNSVQNTQSEIASQQQQFYQQKDTVEKTIQTFYQQYETTVTRAKEVDQHSSQVAQHLRVIEGIECRLIELRTQFENYNSELQAIKQGTQEVQNIYNAVSEQKDYVGQQVEDVDEKIQNMNQVCEEIRDVAEKATRFAQQVSNHATDVEGIQAHLTAFSHSKVEEMTQVSQQARQYLEQVEDIQARLCNLGSQVASHHRDCQEIRQSFIVIKQEIDRTFEQAEQFQQLGSKFDCKQQEADAVYQNISSLVEHLGGKTLLEKLLQEAEANVERKKTMQHTLQEVVRLRNENQVLHSEVEEKYRDIRDLVERHHASISKMQTVMGNISSFEKLIEDVKTSNLKAEQARQTNNKLGYLASGAVLFTFLISVFLGVRWSAQCRFPNQFYCQPIFWMQNR